MDIESRLANVENKLNKILSMLNDPEQKMSEFIENKFYFFKNYKDMESKLNEHVLKFINNINTHQQIVDDQDNYMDIYIKTYQNRAIKLIYHEDGRIEIYIDVIYHNQH